VDSQIEQANAPKRPTRRFFESPWSGPLVFLLFLFLAFACYRTVLDGGFQVDDWWWARNAKQGGLLGNDHNAAGQGLFYRPAVSIAFGTLWRLFGPIPIAYRLFNVLLLATTAYGIFASWLRLTARQVTWSAVAVGAMFVVWPTHAETVSWIAGMTDGLAVALASLSLWSFIVYRQRGGRISFAAALVLLAAALLSKEAVAPMPVLMFAFCAITIPYGRSNRKRALVDAAALVAVLLAYIGLRAYATGHLVGGYSGTSPSSIWDSLSTGQLTTNLANAYLPFAKYYVLWFQYGSVAVLLRYFLVGGLALMLWNRPRKASAPAPRVSLLAFSFLIVSVLVRLFDGPDWLTFLVAPALAIAVFQFDIRLQPALMRGSRVHLPVAVSILMLILLWKDIASVETLLAIVAYLVLISQMRSSRVAKPGDSGWIRLCLAAFLAAFFALIPTLNLPVSIEGQESRFSYLATLFSVVAIGAFFVQVARTTNARRAWSGAGLAFLVVLLFFNVRIWSRAGQITKWTTQAMEHMSQAPRVFVLTAPATYGGAGVFLGGIDWVPYVAFNRQQPKVILASQIMNLEPGDRIVSRRVGVSDFQVILVRNPAAALAMAEIEPLRLGDVQEVEASSLRGILFRINDLTPYDRVMVVSDRGAKVLF
jgi:hypothetical protein